MFLSKSKIEECLQNKDFEISPFDPSNLKQASYTLSLDSMLKVDGKDVTISDEGYTLQPNEFVLGTTVEKLKLNNKFCCFLSNRGSVAQAGIHVLLGSDFLEPDTDSKIILEIHNLTKNSVKLTASMKIVKAIFARVD